METTPWIELLLIAVARVAALEPAFEASLRSLEDAPLVGEVRAVGLMGAVALRPDLLAADEAFVTGSLKELMPLTTLDGRKIGSGSPGPVVRLLQKRYREAVEEERLAASTRRGEVKS